MSIRTLPALFIFFLSVAVVPAQIGIGGSWTMTATVSQPPCVYSGSASIIQSGSEISGTASLTLVEGSEDCPAEMSADVSGVIDGSAISGELSNSLLGTASFVGTVGVTNGVAVQIEAQVAPGSQINGNTTVDTGAFEGSTATWNAEKSVLIPTLNQWGLLLLAALLMAASLFVLKPYMP